LKVSDIVCDPFGLDELLTRLPAAAQLPEAHTPDSHEQLSPVAAGDSGGQKGLIPVAFDGVVLKGTLFYAYSHFFSVKNFEIGQKPISNPKSEISY
jgi:hypothetical protein